MRRGVGGRCVVCILWCVAMGLTACQSTSTSSGAVSKADPSLTLTSIRDQLARGEVVEARQRAWRLSSEHPDTAEIHVVLASAYALEGRYDEALRSSQRATELAPKKPGGWLTQGVALEGLGRFDDAVVATQAVLQIDDKHVGALRNLMRLHRRQGKLEDERRAIERLVALKPTDAELRVMLARSFASIGDFKQAVVHARAALERAPDSGEIHTFLAAGLYATDDLKAAMDHAVIALRLNADRQDAQDVFRAAFFVEVSRALICAHGKRAYTDEEVATMLQRYEAHGVSDVASFHDLRRMYGKRPEVQERISRASRACPPVAPSGGVP